jgi:hypothetical protein
VRTSDHDLEEESWIRDHLRLGPIRPTGRLLLYTVAVIVVLTVA